MVDSIEPNGQMVCRMRQYEQVRMACFARSVVPSIERLVPEHSVGETMTGVLHPMLDQSACRDRHYQQ
jgi:hypothetical protein